MEGVLKFIGSGGAEGAIVAAIITVLTALIKIPVKKYAQKQPIPERITRFIPIIPFALGGILSLPVVWWQKGEIVFGESYFQLWLCSAGLSIALYSCYENIRDGGRVAFEDAFKATLFAFLKERLGSERTADVKELTERIADLCRRERNGLLKNGLCEEVRELLKDRTDGSEADEVAKRAEELWTELYGGGAYPEEVETVACTATKKYEYEVRKSRISSKTNAGKSEEEE